MVDRSHLRTVRLPAMGLALIVALGCSGCLADLSDYWAALHGDAGSSGDLDADSDSDSDSDADSDADSDGDSDSEMDAGDDDGGCTDTETGSGTGSDTDTDVDTDSDADGGQADSGPDGGAPPDDGGCPPDMTRVTAADIPGVTTSFCVDIYEASRDDATSTGGGVDNTVARSVPDVIPWWNNPMNAGVLATYEAACATAGKRLCRCDEWYPACAGQDTWVYVYGDTFDQTTCNNIGACCQDYCDDHLIDPCDTGYNCGSTYGCNEIVPTASFPGCTNGLGTFDMSGNVWEICLSTIATSGYDIRAGAFNCWSPDYRLQCGYAATWTSLYAGFRCCKDPE